MIVCKNASLRYIMSRHDEGDCCMSSVVGLHHRVHLRKAADHALLTSLRKRSSRHYRGAGSEGRLGQQTYSFIFSHFMWRRRLQTARSCICAPIIPFSLVNSLILSILLILCLPRFLVPSTSIPSTLLPIYSSLITCPDHFNLLSILHFSRIYLPPSSSLGFSHSVFC